MGTPGYGDSERERRAKNETLNILPLKENRRGFSEKMEAWLKM